MRIHHLKESDYALSDTRHHNLTDLTGQTFDRLTVIGYLGQNYSKTGAYWLVKCQCGAVKPVAGFKLRKGRTRSCGCIGVEALVKRSTKHGAHLKPEYAVYQSAKIRCTCPTTKPYPEYGGRGIEFRFNSFEEFIATIGYRPSADYSLDRIDNDGHYEPGNVRWTTRQVQGNNRRSSTHITLRGRTQTATEWAREMGMSPEKFAGRVKAKFCDDCILDPSPKRVICTHR